MSSARNFRRSQNVFYERTHPILIRGCVAGEAACLIAGDWIYDAGDSMYDACCLPTANFDLFFGAAFLCAVQVARIYANCNSTVQWWCNLWLVFRFFLNSKMSNRGCVAGGAAPHSRRLDERLLLLADSEI